MSEVSKIADKIEECNNRWLRLVTSWKEDSLHYELGLKAVREFARKTSEFDVNSRAIEEMINDILSFEKVIDYENSQ